MKAGDIYEQDGRKFRAVEFDRFLCTNCKRATLTGLCGCSWPSPVECGRSLVGLPLEAEEALT